MAIALKPLNRIKLFFQGLAGTFNEEFDDDEGYDKNELAEIVSISEKNINSLEEKHGKQTMVVDDDKEETDRLGIKKPKNLNRTQQRTKATVETEKTKQSDDGREDL